DAGSSMFNTITGASREDRVIDAHFARVFNLDESIGTMLRNPRVVFGLLRYRVKDLFGWHKIPFGFDAALDPPGKVWASGAAGIESSAGLDRSR
ncbi:MAG: hypothetical protein ABIO67_07635, partial [Mycobacteriales bacterium]